MKGDWISPAELYAHSGDYLGRVKYAKESFLIKKRGRVLAELTPVSERIAKIITVSGMRKNLSNILGAVSLSGTSFLIMNRNRAWAMLVPERKK